MTCEVYEGDRVEIRVPYGLFRGTVNDFRKINHKEYSIKLVKIEILDESIATGSRSNDQDEEKETLSCHRFWHYEIQDLKILKRHQSPEKVINQGLFNIHTIQISFARDRIPTAKLKISGKNIFEIRIRNFCYIQVIVFDLSYLPVAAVGT